MGEHTPTPWEVSGEGLRALVRGADLTIVAVRHRLPADIHAANAAFIVEAVNNHARLTRENEAMKAALEPFAAVAEHDIGDSEVNADFFRPMRVHNRAPQLTVGDLRRARTTLSSLKEPGNAQA